MVALPHVFKTADLPDSGGGVVHIPDGKYSAVIVESDLKKTQKGGHYLQLKIVITQGQYADTELFERLNIINDNQTAVEIAFKTLARISESVGMDSTPQDSKELHNKPLIIELATEAGKPWKDKDGVEREGKDKSIIKKYHAAGGASTPAGVPQAATNAPKMPWQKG